MLVWGGWRIWGIWGRRGGGEGRGETNIFQHFDFGGYAFDLLVVLVLELREDGVAVLASVQFVSRLAFSLSSSARLFKFRSSSAMLRSHIPLSSPRFFNLRDPLAYRRIM